MATRPEIGFGDLVLALGRMGLLGEGASAEDAQRVARVLGLESVRVATVAPVTVEASASLTVDARIETTMTVTRRTPPTPAIVDSSTASLSIVHGTRAAGAPPPLAEQLAPPSPDDAADLAVPLDPLFAPASSRSLLATALASRQLEGSIDIARLVHRAATRRPIVRIPRRASLTVRRGAQLLIDHGPGMEPFTRDAAALVEQIVAIMGDHRVEVLRFAGDPLTAGRGPRRTWRPWRVPSSSARIIAVTDLGIAAPDLGLPSPQLAWHALARQVAAADSSLLCIVPYPPSQWPAALADTLSIIPWDRGTTVAQVRRLLRGRG